MIYNFVIIIIISGGCQANSSQPRANFTMFIVINKSITQHSIFNISEWEFILSTFGSVIKSELIIIAISKSIKLYDKINDLTSEAPFQSKIGWFPELVEKRNDDFVKKAFVFVVLIFFSKLSKSKEQHCDVCETFIVCSVIAWVPL